MKRSGQSVLVLTILLGSGVLATPAFAQQDEGRSTNQHVEIGVHGGYLFGGRLDINAACTPIPAGTPPVTDGCGAGTPFANKAGGGLTATSGGDIGVRVGMDVTPRWQIEATWDRAYARLAFQDEFGRIGAEGGPPTDTITVNSGQPQGFLNIYQFNLNYHLRKTGRVVPYIGGGAGWISFENPPGVILGLDVVVDGAAVPVNTLVMRLSEANSFAFNFGAGVKMYATPHIGFRLDARPLFSFYRANQSVQTFVNDPVTGLPTTTLAGGEANNTTRQHSTFVHASITAGVFVRF